MSQAETGRRAYRSDLRARQARATRRAVVAAAADLFVQHGYAATTLDAIAQAAGVSRRTVVNAAAGGKAALLKLAWDWSLVGDDEPVPMAERPAVRRIRACTDPAEAIRLWVAMVVEVQARAAPIGHVLAAAADVDPDAAALLARADAERYQGALAFAGDLARLGGLRADLTVELAADVCWAQNDAVLYRRLVIERGWPPERFGEWLVRTVTAALRPV